MVASRGITKSVHYTKIFHWSHKNKYALQSQDQTKRLVKASTMIEALPIQHTWAGGTERTGREASNW